MDASGQLDALLSSLVAAGRPSSMSLPRRQSLQNFAELAQWLAGPSSAPAGQDLTIAGPAGEIAVRIYRPGSSPRSGGAHPPAAVFFHGGGWVLGGLESHDTLCRELAALAGIVLVAVDYRLAPEHPYPAGLEDCLAATRWVVAHAADLGADSSRLAVVGDSAGASLAAAVAIAARDDGDLAVSLQVLAYPALDPAMDTPSYAENADDPFLSRTEMESYWAHYLGSSPPSCLAAPALVQDLTGLPSAFIVVAGRDVLRDEGVSYAERLVASGVPVQVRRFDTMVHGFLLCTAWLDAARDGVVELAAAVRSGLGQAGSQ